MKHASLCTGIGAAELAAKWMGWENLFSCEIDEFCNKVLKYHYPNTIHYGNIFEQNFSEWRGRVDVLTAGFPCQPFSVAGQRAGAEDNRYLWPEVLRVVSEIQPTWFVGENVAGIASMVFPGSEITVGRYTDTTGESYEEMEMRQQFIIDRICNDIESIGYYVQPISIPACGIGAPHRRDRIWFIANRDCTGLQETRAEQQATGIAGGGLQRDVADPKCVRSDEVHEEIQSKQSNGDGTYGNGNERTVADTNRNRRGKWENKQKSIAGSQGKTNDCSCREDGITSDPDGERCHDRSDNWEKRQVRTKRERGTTEDKSKWNKRECRVGEDGSTASDTTKQRLQERINDYERKNEEKARTRVDDRLERYGNKRVSLDSNGERREEFHSPEISSEQKQSSGRYTKIPNWQNFPTTKPTICSGDDGFPGRLSGISFPRWRQESIKALGNSMVAPLIYEIFNVIEIVENNLSLGRLCKTREKS